MTLRDRNPNPTQFAPRQAVSSLVQNQQRCAESMPQTMYCETDPLIPAIERAPNQERTPDPMRDAFSRAPDRRFIQNSESGIEADQAYAL